MDVTKSRGARAMNFERSRSGAYALVLTLSLCACADHIGRGELLAQLDAGSAPAIVDVRSRGEFETSHVPGAVHIPFYSILGSADVLPEPAAEDQPIVLYCEHGPRAGIARAQLWFVSDRPVRFLEGHMTAWKSDGLPVESPAASESGAPGDGARPQRAPAVERAGKPQ
jgi:rhodanese-related sulfurtransferase